jgi:hypothetical protein
MSNSILNKNPKYYIFEDPSIKKGHKYTKDDGTGEKAIGSRIQTVNVNGKKKQAVVFFISEKNANASLEAIQKFEEDTASAAQHIKNLLMQHPATKSLTKEDKELKINKALIKLQLDVNIPKSLNDNGKEITLWNSTSLISPERFLMLMDGIRLPIRTNVTEKMPSLKSAKSILASAHKSNELKKQYVNSEKMKHAEKSAEFKSNAAAREADFFKPKIPKNTDNITIPPSEPSTIKSPVSATNNSINNDSIIKKTNTPRSAREIAGAPSLPNQLKKIS